MTEIYIKVKLYGIKGLMAKEYDYVSYVEVAVGDAVVVETTYGYAIGQVVTLCKCAPMGVSYEILEVVEKVDLDGFAERTAKRHRKDDLRHQMYLLKDAMLENASEEKIFEIFAMSNPEIQILLEEYRSL